MEVGGTEVNCKRTWGSFGGNDKFVYYLMIVSQVYTCVKTHETMHSTYVQFNIIKYTSKIGEEKRN